MLQAFHMHHVFSLSDVNELEIDILCALRGYVHAPTIFTFLGRFMKAGELHSDAVQLCTCISDHCLLTSELLRLYPSQIASGCVYIVRKSYGMFPVWSFTLQYYTNYEETAVLGWVSLISDACFQGSSSIDSTTLPPMNQGRLRYYKGIINKNYSNQHTIAKTRFHL